MHVVKRLVEQRIVLVNYNEVLRESKEKGFSSTPSLQSARATFRREEMKAVYDSAARTIQSYWRMKLNRKINRVARENAMLLQKEKENIRLLAQSMQELNSNTGRYLINQSFFNVHQSYTKILELFTKNGSENLTQLLKAASARR
eukprot:TRINITY_DN2890_c0_g1_i9.p2 TRINITY_DN2890_c0_g1~~TRINITY_DN2890_c0_g1_i9.p2  ORF type:complete len:145 (+),score=36.88 TRINITY_DN2890_c0_g1_i9:530-964(+)